MCPQNLLMFHGFGIPVREEYRFKRLLSEHGRSGMQRLCHIFISENGNLISIITARV